MLFNLKTLDWDDELLELFNIPRTMLPRVSCFFRFKVYGMTQRSGPLKAKVPLCADLGDQQAATVGQVCFAPGEAKNTYGTGNFMLLNTGTNIVPSHAGLLTTVCYSRWCAGGLCPRGSVAVTGSAVQWLRDQLGLIKQASDIEASPTQSTITAVVLFRAGFSPDFTRPIGGRTRGVALSGCLALTTKVISRARHWRQFAIKLAMSWMQW
jgi:glycerol kinase